ncbi:MAG: choice-of-anchor N protein [Candidatus Zixiibacteriota bacterium]|nr:MAG: choice-of-anchor N protein [candidate division Zixibacteria bacterium]
MNVNFGGTAINPGDWLFGFPPLPPELSPGNDLAPHSIYPAYFAEIRTGSYGDSLNVGDVQPDMLLGGEYWDPTPTPAFPGAPANADGDWKMFTVDINGPVGASVHFDAFTLDSLGNVLRFAPYSHDATTTIVPEPGTIVLMGSGLLGLGLRAYRKRKRS